MATACPRSPSGEATSPSGEATSPSGEATSPSGEATSTTSAAGRPAAGLQLTCPAGLRHSETAGVRGQRLAHCVDENGERQGSGLVSRADGTRLAMTTWLRDREQGPLTLFDETERVIVRGQTAGGRLLSYELDESARGDAARLKPLEERLQDEIARAQRCGTDAECVLASGGQCPFGCGIVTHKDEADRVGALLAGYPSACQTKCRGGGEPRCHAGRCELAYH